MSLQNQKDPHPVLQALALCGLLATFIWLPMAIERTNAEQDKQMQAISW